MVTILTTSITHAAPSGLERPLRLTAGASNQLLGVLDATGRRLFYVDDGESTWQIRVQSIDGGAPRLLFDEAADVTWPRPSPDGKSVLYVSHQSAAAGQACVRDLDALGRAGPRRCLGDESLAVSQAQWLPGGREALVLLREKDRGDVVRGDLVLQRLSTSPIAAGAATVLPAFRNAGSPALSPDGRHLAYVPIDRRSAEVGPNFAGDVARAIEVRALGLPGGGAPIARLDFDRRRAGGFPAFSADGRWLYFTLFLNDTDQDGRIDGNDAGVLFRAPFDPARSPAVDPARAEQLTSAAWNCQYPAPAAMRLVATCLFEGAAHVYALPLEGAVPTAWDRARLDDEITSTRDRWERLLLLGRRLAALGATPDERAARRRTLLDMIELHLQLGELESAEIYTEDLAALDEAAPGRATLASVLGELIMHRHDERALGRGQLSERFIAASEARKTKLAAVPSGAGGGAGALARLVEAEILDAIGELPHALKVLRSVSIPDLSEPFVLHAFADRAVALYRDDPARVPALLDLLRALADHPALPPFDRLRIAERFTSEVLRGRPRAEAPALLERQAAAVDPTTDLGFRVELERRLIGLEPGLDEKAAEKVRERVFELYRKHRDFDRRRSLVDALVRRASRADSGYLLYQFATTWASWVEEGRAERRVAEDLYRRVVLERAYIDRARGETSEARGHFFGVTLQTESLEAHIGFVEQRLREGKSEADVGAEYRERFAARGPGARNEAVHRFVRAYLLARRLPSIREAEAHLRATDEAVALLAEAARTGALAGQAELHHLWGYVLHQRYLRATDHVAAEEAVGHYRLAGDLARERPRLRAAVFESLALLQAAVGNHAIAIGWFDERDRLPWTDPTAELHHRLEKARSLFHLDRDRRAVVEIEACLALAVGERERFRPLVVDRAALYHLAAGDAAAALAHYRTLLPSVESQPAGPERTRNVFAARLGRAAAAIAAGDAAAGLADLDAIEPAPPADFDPLVAPATRTRDDYRLIFAGLRAAALGTLGRLDEAAASQEKRRDLLAARHKKTGLDEDLYDRAHAEARLADLATRRKRFGDAARHVEAALRTLDAFSESTGMPLTDLGLDLVLSYAALHVDAGVPRGALAGDVERRVEGAYAALRDQRLPAWALTRERLAAYLVRLRLGGGR